MRPWRRRRDQEPAADAIADPAASPIGDEPLGESVRVVPATQSPRAAEAPAADGPAAVPAPAAPPVPGPVPNAESRPATIVIGDDDAFLTAPDALSSPLPRDGSGALPIDPRLRRRRIDVRRAAGRKRLVVVLALVAVFAVAIAALAVLASPLFSVSEVRISGNVYTTDEELAPIIERAKDHAILTLDTDEIARQLEELPWVRRARVQADFPSTLTIELAERRPVAAYAGSDAQWRVIDRDGRVIAIIPDGAQPADYLPIEGAGPDVAAGTLAGDPYRIAGELAQSLPTELRNVTASITMGELGTMGLRLTSGTLVEFGQPSDLRTKLSVLITLLRERDPVELASVNLSDPFNPGIIPTTESPTSGG